MRNLITVICLLLLASVSMAQTATPTRTPTPTSTPFNTPVPFRQCDYGLPCGNVPWRLPLLPGLNSPTPFASAVFTATLTPTGTPPTSTLTPTGTLPTSTATFTITPSATNTASAFDIDVAPAEDSIATLQSLMASTPMTMLDANGTPVAMDTQYEELSTNAEVFFGYVRGLGEVSFGSLTPLISLTMLAFVIVMGTKLTTFLLPLFSAVFGLIRKIVQVILDFIPL